MDVSQRKPGQIEPPRKKAKKYDTCKNTDASKKLLQFLKTKIKNIITFIVIFILT